MISIDLGSNTLRVLAYDCKNGKKIAEFEKVVKTADGLADSRLIKESAIQRVIVAIKEAQLKIDFSSHKVKAVTTEAVRRASNSQEVIQRIKQETKIGFNIITGEQEASYTLNAVKYRLNTLDFDANSFVLVDIGGGSTELIFCFKNEKMISKSFPVGIVTIAQSYENLENIEKALPHEMLAMKEFCKEMFFKTMNFNTFVATAGTPTTVAAMKLGLNYETYDAQKINGTRLSPRDLDFYLKKLLAMPFEEREVAVGTGRSDLIAAGILIYRYIFSLLNMESCVIIDDGLREGVALVECMKGAPTK